MGCKNHLYQLVIRISQPPAVWTYTEALNQIGISSRHHGFQYPDSAKKGLVQGKSEPDTIAFSIQCEAPKIAKLVYNSNNYGLWYL